METDPSTSSSTEILTPEDSSDSEDDEVLPLTRMDHSLQTMAVLGEDEASHKLTSLYHKCLDLAMEKRRLNTKQTVLRDFFC